MTDEEFMRIYNTLECDLIISQRKNSDDIIIWDDLTIISNRMEYLYNERLDQLPLLKALK
jgi:hypothetical protein